MRIHLFLLHVVSLQRLLREREREREGERESVRSRERERERKHDRERARARERARVRERNRASEEGRERDFLNMNESHVKRVQMCIYIHVYIYKRVQMKARGSERDIERGKHTRIRYLSRYAN